MRTKNPLRGLLQFHFYSVSGNAAFVILIILALAAVLLITGNNIVKNLFVAAGTVALPYTIMSGMGGKAYPKWERFQLTMPLGRSHLIGSHYLVVFLASLIGFPLIILALGMTFSLHEAWFDYNFTTALLGALSFLAFPLIMAGLIFPIAITKFGEGRGEALFVVCSSAAIGVFILISWLGNRVNLATDVISLVKFGTSVLVFAVSYFITRQIYAKLDF